MQVSLKLRRNIRADLPSVDNVRTNLPTSTLQRFCPESRIN